MSFITKVINYVKEDIQFVVVVIAILAGGITMIVFGILDTTEDHKDETATVQKKRGNAIPMITIGSLMIVFSVMLVVIEFADIINNKHRKFGSYTDKITPKTLSFNTTKV